MMGGELPDQECLIIHMNSKQAEHQALLMK